MDIERSDLEQAAVDGILTPDQVDKLWATLSQRRANDGGVRVSPSTGRIEPSPTEALRARFDLVHVAWYAGALLVMGAMGWFATLGLEAWGGPGILTIALCYAALFAFAGVRMWNGAELKTLGGILTAVAVAMVPLAVYGFERTIGWWPDVDPGRYEGFYDWVKGGWFGIEWVTIVAGIVAVRVVPYSFVLLPVALCAWFMSMDLAPLVYADPSTAQRGMVSAVVGAGLLGTVYLLHRNKSAHLSYWLAAAGAVAFDGGLAAMKTDSLWTKPVFLAVQIAFLVAGAQAGLSAFLLVGAVGAVGVGLWATTQSHDAVLASFVIGVPARSSGLWLHRRTGDPRWHLPSLTMVLVGAGVLAVGPFDVWSDRRAFGPLALYAAGHAALVVLGAVVASRALTTVAGLALTTFVLWLSHEVFSGSMVFPLVLVSMGIGLVVGGVQLKRHQRAIDAWAIAHVPPALRAMRPQPAVDNDNDDQAN